MGNVASISLAPRPRHLTPPRNRRDGVAHRQQGHSETPAVEEGILGNEQGVGRSRANVAKAASISRLVLARAA